MQRRSFTLWLAAAPPLTAAARTLPAKPVVVFVPFPPGGAADALARQLAPHLSRVLERTVVVENVPGAGGTLAAQKMLSSAPDGSTLMVVSSSETILPPLMMGHLRYQAEDFRLLVSALAAPLALVGRPGLEPRSLEALLSHARGRPPLSFGSLGNGTVTHLAGEHFTRLTGMPLLHVPYRGGAPLANDLVANQVDLGLLPLAGQTLQLAAHSRIHVFGIAGTHRPPLAAAYPLLVEHPALRTFVHTAWTSFAVSKAVPDVLAQALNEALNTVLQMPEQQAFAQRMGSSVPPPATLAEVASFYARETAATRELAKAVNLQAE